MEKRLITPPHHLASLLHMLGLHRYIEANKKSVSKQSSMQSHNLKTDSKATNSLSAIIISFLVSCKSYYGFIIKRSCCIIMLF